MLSLGICNLTVQEEEPITASMTIIEMNICRQRVLTRTVVDAKDW